MSYTLYICNHCNGCAKVLSFIERENISIQSINLDVSESNLNFPIIVIPALVEENKLLAYGVEIIDYLKSKKNETGS